MNKEAWKMKARIVEHYGNQWKFSQVVGMHESDISRVINGRKTLDVERQRQWAKALKCGTEELFGTQK